MNMTNPFVRSRQVELVALVWQTFPAVAQRGGGNGGCGGGWTSTHSIIELPVMTLEAHRISNPDSESVVTVAGNGSESGYTAACARVNTANQSVVNMGYLPEPTDGGPDDFASNAVAANSAGTIVGSADIVDPSVNGDRRSVPIRWFRQNGTYQYQFLPIPPDELWRSVNAINEVGIMVGATNDGDVPRAIIWSADGAVVTERLGTTNYGLLQPGTLQALIPLLKKSRHLQDANLMLQKLLVTCRKRTQYWPETPIMRDELAGESQSRRKTHTGLVASPRRSVCALGTRQFHSTANRR